MINTELTSLDNIFNYVPKTIRREQRDDAQIKSWALQAWKSLYTPLRYVKDIIFLQVTDHKTDLPDCIKKIIRVTLLGDINNVEQVNSLYECACTTPTGEEDIIPTGTLGFDTACNTYYRLFTSSKAYRECFTPLRYIGTWGDSFVCKGGYTTTCENTYTLVGNNTGIQTSFKDGVIAIEYFSEMTDEEGNYMLPKSPEKLWQYLSAYVKARHWEERMSGREDGTYSLYQQYRMEEVNWGKEVRGYFNGKAIRFRNLEGIIYGETDLIRVPQFVLERFNYFYNQNWLTR